MPTLMLYQGILRQIYIRYILHMMKLRSARKMTRWDEETLILNLCQLHQEEEQWEKNQNRVTRMRTRYAETSGESIPFTKKELQEPSFIEHIVHAEIHNPPNQSNNTRSLQNTKTPDMENNIQNPSFEMENNENSNIDTPISSVIIPPDLLQIINNLARDLEQNETY